MKATVSFGVGGVNVRKNSTVRSKRLDALEPGHEVEVIEERDGWLHVKYLQADEECRGWAVRSAFVIEWPPEPPMPPDVDPVVIEQPTSGMAERGFWLLAAGFGTVAAIYLTKVFLHIQ